MSTAGTTEGRKSRNGEHLTNRKIWDIWAGFWCRALLGQTPVFFLRSWREENSPVVSRRQCHRSGTDCPGVGEKFNLVG